MLWSLEKLMSLSGCWGLRRRTAEIYTGSWWALSLVLTLAPALVLPLLLLFLLTSAPQAALLHLGNVKIVGGGGRSESETSLVKDDDAYLPTVCKLLEVGCLRLPEDCLVRTLPLLFVFA